MCEGEMRKLKSFLNFLPILFFLTAVPVRAQYIGTTSPQTAIATLASNLPCTGLAQNFTTGITPNFDNLGQTQHFASVSANVAVTNLQMQIQGIDSAGNVHVISDTASTAQPAVGANATLTGTGYFPNIRVVVTCFPATTGIFTLNYTGTSSTPNVNTGSYQIAQLDKTIGSFAPAGTTFAPNLMQTPFGNSYGVIYFQFLAAAGPAGSTANVTCQTPGGASPPTFTFNLATTQNAEQIFYVPSGPCVNLAVNYTSGGASAATYVFEYVFLPPGSNQPNAYTHITGTTATVVKIGPGVLHTLVIGTPAAGTVSLFDLAPAACTGTPATNVVSVITVIATTTPPPYIYDSQFFNGICVKASVAMDITVSSQ